VFGKHETEILVVGAGPVGLFAAAQFTRRGLKTEIVEAESQGAGLSYALALHPRSVELLDGLGLAEDAVRVGYRVERLAFYEGATRRTEVDLSAIGGKHPYLTIVPQSLLEAALEEWLHRHKVPVRWRHRVTGISGVDGPAEVALERWGEDTAGYAVARRTRVIEKTFPMQARFVLGADGHSSAVRRALAIDYPELAPAALFAVFEFETDADLKHEARVILGGDTISVLWPMPNGRCRWSFQLADAEAFEGERVKNRLSELGRWVFPTLNEDRLRALIAERAPWFTAAIKEVAWSVAIKFERRLASGFGRGALWLAGDAAHLAGPVGVQSMNVGFREVDDLAERLESMLRGGASPAALAEYDAMWRGEWRRLFALDGTLRAGAGASPFVAGNAATILSCLTASGEHLDPLLRQLDLTLG
jgi:2-polyprenyl-6-methoxyphenol hydroxylase-like FAD-dependent oxidoreductase